MAAFEDPMYGTLFDAHGRYRGGPAPAGLDTYPISENVGDTVTVTGPAHTQQREAEGGPAPVPPVGTHCFGGDGGYVEGYNPGTLQLHTISSQTPMSPAEAIEQPEGAVVLVDAPVVIARGQGAVVCTTGVDYSTAPVCEGIPAPDLVLPDDETWAVLTGRFLARPVQGTLTAMAYVSEQEVRWASS